MRHQEHRVDVPATLTNVIFHGVHHVLGNQLTCVGPFIQHMVVSLLTGHQTTIIRLLQLHDLFLSSLDEVGLRIGSHQVIGCKRQTRSGRLTETELHHVIEQVNRGSTSNLLVAIANHTGQVTASHCLVVEIHSSWKHFVEANTTRGRFNHIAIFSVTIFGLELLVLR